MFQSKSMKGKKLDVDFSNVLELYANGMSQREIAEKLNVGQASISRYLKEHGDGVKRFNLNTKLDKSPSWKGGRTLTRGGYVLVKAPEHPKATNAGYVLEHVLVMEEHLGRCLNYISKGHRQNEIVHHVNGQKQDNRIENLRLMTSSEHMTLHNLERGAFLVRRLDTNQVYESVKEAADSVGLSHHTIRWAINKQRKAAGVNWEYVNSDGFQ